jgi:hypothetical protein
VVGAGKSVEANWDRLARAWFQVGDHERAATCLARAVALGAHEPETALLMGRVARSEGRFAEALDWLTRAARQRSRDWEVQEDLGLTFYLAGRLPEAADAWERARALPGSEAPLRSGLLEVLAPRGRGRLPRSRPRPGAAGVWRRSPARRDGGAAECQRSGAVPVPRRHRQPEVVLGRSLASELGLKTVPGGETGLFVGDQPVRLDYSTLDSLTLGETSLGPLPIAISDHAALAKANGIRGTLGLERCEGFVSASIVPTARCGWSRSQGTTGDSTRRQWLPPGSRVHRVPLLLRGTSLLVAYGTVGKGPERPFLVDMGGPGVGLAAPMSTIAESRSRGGHVAGADGDHRCRSGRLLPVRGAENLHRRGVPRLAAGVLRDLPAPAGKESELPHRGHGAERILVALPCRNRPGPLRDVAGRTLAGPVSRGPQRSNAVRTSCGAHPPGGMHLAFSSAP